MRRSAALVIAIAVSFLLQALALSPTAAAPYDPGVTDLTATWSGTITHTQSRFLGLVIPFEVRSTVTAELEPPEAGAAPTVDATLNGRLTEYSQVNTDPCDGWDLESATPDPFTAPVDVFAYEGRLWMDTTVGPELEIDIRDRCGGPVSNGGSSLTSDLLTNCDLTPGGWSGTVLDLGPVPAGPGPWQIQRQLGETCGADPRWQSASWSTTIDLVSQPREIRGCVDSPPVATLSAQPDPSGESNDVTFGINVTTPGSTYRFRRHGEAIWETVSPGVRTITYPQAAEWNAQLVVTDPDGCTATDTVRFAAGAITAYAPTIWFHPEENYFPGSANDFIQQSQLVWWQHPRCGRTQTYYAAGVQARDVGGVKQKQLNFGTLSGKSGRVYVAKKRRATLGPRGAIVGCKTVKGTAKANGAGEFVQRHNDDWPRSSGFYLNLLNRPRWQEGDRDRARVYYTYKPEEYVAYWIFSPYNGWRGDGFTEIHEGDWEHIVVDLEERNLAQRSAFYQHNCDAVTQSWDNTPREEPGSSHPALFAALGGHASYSADPAEIGRNKPETNCSLPKALQPRFKDRIGKGEQWRPWEGQLTRASLQRWWGFGGAWGDRSSKSNRLWWADNYGPAAPGPRNVGVPPLWR